MNIETQAITLSSVSFQERKKIVTLFTEKGLISLILKNISSKNTKLLNFINPFTISNIIYKKGRSDIYFLKDFTIIDENFFLRKDLKFITTAFDMAKAILDSQMLHKNTPLLYKLFKKYLKTIDKIPQNTLSISFFLKILLHDGFISLKKCTQCQKDSCFTFQGESLCEEHSNKFYFNKFSKEEFEKIKILTYSKNFALLKTIETDSDFKEKIKILFKDLI